MTMRTGEQYIKSLNDGRRVFVNGERVDDVTSYPAFQGVLDTLASLYDAQHDPGRGALTQALAAHAAPVLTPAGVRRTLEMFVVDTSLVTDELVELRYRSALNDTAGDRLADVVAARDRDRTALPLDLNVLAELDLPVLLIHGTQDVVIPVSWTLQLLQVLPRADVHIFSQCGHWSQVERAEEFNRVVGSWLTERGA
jgi:2-hydroxymuconate-semialdehyde hydrolase